MSDFRFCSICSLEIDIEEPGTEVFDTRAGNGTRTLVIDPDGLAHSVTTKRLSERKRLEKDAAPSREGEVDVI